MIPNELIDKAAKAIKHRASFQAWRGEGYPPEVLARAALETVAADIWDEGNFAGCDRSENHDNPYRIEHA